jgi:hypothetical protein
MMKIRAAVAGLGVMLAVAATASGPEVPRGETPDPAVLRLREAAWRAWFAGDEAALGRVLPPEFIGINMQAGPLSSRDETVAQAKAYRAAGGRLVRLEFPETRAQRYGDVVVLYGRYVAVMESGGVEQTVSGRLTEVFVRRDGGWLHPGWHLDTVAAP